MIKGRVRFFTSLGESRSSIVSAGSLEHATSDRATMQKPARPGSETTPWLFPEKLTARRGRFLPQITALQLTLDQIPRSRSFYIYMKQNKGGFGVLKRLGGVSPPVLLRSWVSLLRLRSQSSLAGSMGVFTKRGGGRERRGTRDGERGEDASS